ncbi:UNVERIFIED_CONTAM: hypothetical protein K2H54_065813 [Gekko kuhli]
MGFLQWCLLLLGTAPLLPGGCSGNGCNNTGNQFQCDDGFCIPASWACDGYFHCPDDSDEANCTCSSDQFTCKNGHCIPALWRCDGFNQCGDESDEVNCTCSSSQFACRNGRCIPASWACEGHDDCGDLSDETNCTCASSQLPCENGLCIAEDRACNGFDDCGDNSDEDGCPCSGLHFVCHGGSCVPRRYVCDGLKDCGDASDEANCSLSCPAGQFRCRNSLCIPEHWTCNQCNDCGDNTDEAACRQPCASYQFTCDSGLCVPMQWICDGSDDCGDDSDEAYIMCANQSSFTHSLRYLSMSVSQPSAGVPWFATEGYVDGQPFERYDSNTRRNVPEAPWMEKVGKDYPHYWDRTTNDRRNAAVMSGTALELMGSFFNHTEGFHMLQDIFVCRLREDGQKSVFRSYGYDGKGFDFTAQVTKRKWEAEKDAKAKITLEEDCVEWLQKCLHYGREDLLKREPPIVKVTWKADNDSQETLFCQAYGFYPEQIQMTWRKDGEVLELKTLRGGVVPNSDWTYHTWISIRIDHKDRDRYWCHVEHTGLQEPMDVAWEKSGERLKAGGRV